MTDLSNDATYNLETGASGIDPLAKNGAGASTQGATKAEELALNTAREIENRAYQARDWAMTQSDTVRTTVLDKPFVSIGTAFAAGIVFGLLLRR